MENMERLNEVRAANYDGKGPSAKLVKIILLKSVDLWLEGRWNMTTWLRRGVCFGVDDGTAAVRVRDDSCLPAFLSLSLLVVRRTPRMRARVVTSLKKSGLKRFKRHWLARKKKPLLILFLEENQWISRKYFEPVGVNFCELNNNGCFFPWASHQ